MEWRLLLLAHGSNLLEETSVFLSGLGLHRKQPCSRSLADTQITHEIMNNRIVHDKNA